MAQEPRELRPYDSVLHYFGAELRRWRTLRGLSQDELGRLALHSAATIGKVEKAARWPTEALAQRCDEALDTGGALARLLPLVVRHRQDHTRLGRSSDVDQGEPSTPAEDVADNDLDVVDGNEAGEIVRRRRLLGLAGAAAADAATRSLRSSAMGRLVTILTSHQDATSPASGPGVALAGVTAAVAATKRNYQACRYPRVLAELPALLDALQRLQQTSNADDLATVHALTADAYHVAGSVLLKLDDVPLAVLAADRSLRAANLSADPVAVAGSSRIVIHALMSGGHPDQAQHMAEASAVTLQRSMSKPSPEGISVLGALTLRGAIAAARAEDRTRAHDMLDEAAGTAQRLGHDHNHRWTAFGPTNVLLHRVNVALALGDAGTAIAIARTIDLTNVQVAERKACLFLDVAQAYAQWGKWDAALVSLHRADAVAPQEVQTRSSAKTLIADLASRAPRSVQIQARTLANRVGVPL